MATWVTIYEDSEKRIERYDVGTPNAEGMTVYPERTIYRNPNYQTIRDQAADAMAVNRASITRNAASVAVANPTNAQVISGLKDALRQLSDLEKQMNGVIRIILDQLDGSD